MPREVPQEFVRDVQKGFWANLNIRQKLMIIFFLLTAVLVAVAVISNLTLNTMMQNLNDFDMASEKTLLASQIVQDMLRIHREEKNMILAKSPEEIESYEKNIKRLRKALEKKRLQFNNLLLRDPRYKSMVENFNGALAEWLKVNEEVRKLKMNREDGPSRLVSGTQGYNTFRKADESIGKIIDSIRGDMEATKEKNNALGKLALKVILWVSVTGTALCIILVALVVVDISKTLRNTVESLAKGSEDLEKAANDQLTGAVALTSTTNEISGTIKDLLVSAREISKNAEKLTRISMEASAECEKGSISLEKSRKEIQHIKEKVQLIARHMLELGQKLQHISGVLEIINELSERTNILSLNATIEAAGAGEAGQRFTVVADEIRKLAEKAMEATKETQVMIEDIQRTSSTTIMVTEDGIKAIDEGLLLFEGVLKSFQKIIKLVKARVETIRKIDESTRQQTMSIDQLNSSIQNVAKTAQQAEELSHQTLKTVLQLVDIASDIERIIGKKK